MKAISVILFTFLLAGHVYPQGDRAFPINSILAYPQSLSIGQLSSTGYSSVFGSSAAVSALNPAALNNFDHLSVALSFQLETQMENIARIENYRLNPGTPQSAGIILPWKDLRLGLGMNQLYNVGLDMGRIPFTTIENPNGTGEFIEPVYKTRIFAYSFGLSYSFNNFLAPKNQLLAGIRLNYNTITDYKKVITVYSDVKDNALSFSAGLMYIISEDGAKYTTGISFDSKFEASGYYKAQQEEVMIDSSNHYYIILPDYYYECNTPSRISTGFLYEGTDRFNFSANLNYILWEDVSIYNNEPQVSASMIYELSETTKGSLGFMFSPLTMKNEYDFNTDSRLLAIYLTAGLALNFNNLFLDISLADSHLTAGEWRRQFIFKFGLGYSF